MVWFQEKMIKKHQTIGADHCTKSQQPSHAAEIVILFVITIQFYDSDPHSSLRLIKH